MTTRPFPERPDLGQLKRQAKDLLRAARDHEPSAFARFRVLPAFARASEDELRRAGLALHDAQSVIAREHGLPSWKALRERVEEATLGLDAAARAFVEAASDGRTDRAERLLAAHPAIAKANLHAALVLGDAEAVGARLAENPALALEPGGPRGWEPLLYVCHDALGSRSMERGEGLVAIARRLLELGADPNARFPWLHHGVRRAVLWGAVHVTGVLPLAGLLLEAGADPDDGVTLPIAAGGGNLPALRLLRAHGADPSQPWATDGAATLYSILQWADTSTGAHWLLEEGADPDPVFPDNGETPFHVVARRWDASLAERLVERGADPTRQRADGRTPYQIAELNGNRSVADWLVERGVAGEISEVDRFVAACSRAERASAEAMLASRPSLRDEIGDDHYVALHRAAERGDAAALETLLACGFDPDHGDEEMGKTPLHDAAMAGWVDAVRVLLAHGASVHVRDREFKGQPLVWAAEGFRSHGGGEGSEGRDHEAVGRLLLEAGSPVDWEAGDEPAQGLLDVLVAWRRG